ncbi:MAG: ABC transporter permease [Planctomycetota bacterium]|jgi:simple sugar transport system permease protein|nr:ABC transporter permease [Planctomycetota bacterium]
MRRYFFNRHEWFLVGVLVVLSAVITCINPSFLSFENITDLLKSFTVLGIFSLGMFMVIVSGGFDISFTAIAQAAQYAVVALLMFRWASIGDIWVAIFLAVLFGLVLGCVNGAIIHFFKIPPIMVTIATQNLYYGIMYVITKGDLIHDIPLYYREFSYARVIEFHRVDGAPYGLTLVTAIWIVLGIAAALFLKYTRLGRSIFALGGNRISAERIGFNICLTTIFVYGAMGAIAGLAAIVDVSIAGSVIPNSIVGKELQIIAAVILGGTAITGGKGSIQGTFLGVFLFAVLSNSLTLLKIPSYYYKVFTGLVILLAVAGNALQIKRQEGKKVRVQVDEIRAGGA